MRKSHLRLSQRFIVGFIVNTSFMMFELVVGLLTGSLVLLADAIHNLTDSVTLVISWVGNQMSNKPADNDHTLGHGRIKVLTAMINSVILSTTAFYIFFEAYQRFIHPVKIQGGIIAATALIGVAANGTVALLFRKYRSDINVHAAYINMAFDMIFSIASMVAGLLILITHKNWIDPAISLGVGLGLLYAAFGILKQSSNIFLEAVPHDVDLKQIRSTINSHSGVEKIHKLYVWGIASNDYALCCSLAPSNNSYNTIENTRQELKESLRDLGFNLVIIEIV